MGGREKVPRTLNGRMNRGCPFGTEDWVNATAKNKVLKLRFAPEEDLKNLPEIPIWLLTPFLV